MKLAITIGDPSGVGPEIIFAWAKNNPQFHGIIEVIAHRDFLDTLPASISKCEISDEVFELGKPCVSGAKLSYRALEVAAKGCIGGKYFAVVTSPVSKASIVNAGYNFIGQTEFFESKWGGDATMCFVCDKIILSLVTWHIPLRAVSCALNFDNIKRAVESVDRLVRKLKGIENPRIAVCGLNPHAGEGGLLGKEEIEVINPCLMKLRKDYPNLSEALSGDSVFYRVMAGEFDGIVSMYHDQGLSALKAIAFDEAVNVSMGLGYIRTSPDHGTGYGIAGKGIAKSKSFEEAVKVAMEMRK